MPRKAPEPETEREHLRGIARLLGTALYVTAVAAQQERGVAQVLPSWDKLADAIMDFAEDTA